VTAAGRVGSEVDKKSMILRAIVKSLVLYLLTGIALYLGSWPLREMFVFPDSLSGQLPTAWLIVVLSFLVGLICLFGARIYLKWVLKARRLTVPLTGLEHWLHTTTFRLAVRSQITPPRIAIYPSRELNAFAVGLFRHRATIVLSEGLVHGLKPEQLESVLAHEVSHIANGDVQVLAMLQGVLNVVVYLPARIVDHILARLWPRYQNGGAMYYFVVTIMQLACGWLASLIIMRFSRACEYRADQGAARLVGLNRMQSALRCLHVMTDSSQPRQLAAFGLSERLKSHFIQLFDSHPSLSQRLRALRQVD
jgi:heat shock protein HtpX